MRTITYGGAISLDGFLAAADGAIDWLHFSKDVSAVMADYWKDVDTILMGRKTFMVTAAMASGSREEEKRQTQHHGTGNRDLCVFAHPQRGGPSGRRSGE